MDLLEILGYISASIIGISLGLIGGGGSILTVPVLVYLIGMNPVVATAYSLFIVGFSSLIGAGKYTTKKLVSYKTAIVFGLPSLIAVFVTRKYVVPAIPETLFQIGNFVFTKDIGLMVLFAILMIAASISMIRGRKEVEEVSATQKFNYPLIVLEGAVVGGLTGLVGAGGGFLIIPALVVLSKLPMKMAIGTSLLIIAIKSLIGFLGDVSNMEIDWVFLGIFSTISVIGIFIGSYLSNFISGSKLKPVFGWFVLIMGIYIITKELFL
jgi:uncharacterized membrane protein YfcA